MNAPATVLRRCERIRVRGTVQGVGFRPHVLRIAEALGVTGTVANDPQGVWIEAWGDAAALDGFAERIVREAPPLARIAAVERVPAEAEREPAAFTIVHGNAGAAATHVPADVATCAACVAEVLDPFARRFRYPFTNCTHCGPRLTIIEDIPYERSATTMASFAMCAACEAEYRDARDRRFHAQPIACHVCGPKLTLSRSDGRALALDSLTFLDEADGACTLLQRGHVVAVQGMGGYQLACDATNAEAVARLRSGKRREAKPFALMARSVDIVKRYCRVDEREAALLSSPGAPIVVLDRLDHPARPIGSQVAPGISTLGFMLPNTPLHHLMLKRMERPIVLTSGNLADEPQTTMRDDARARFGGIAEYFLEHDRPIARRVDDTLARVVRGETRLLRRARGYAPAPLPLPAGFEAAPAVLAYGGELKNTFCMTRAGEAIVSPHIGDLHDALTRADYRKSLDDLGRFFDHRPQALACDAHPGYASTALARERAQAESIPLIQVRHHHAHIAACLAENGVAFDTAPVLGIALDGSGYGDDGTIWGGEFLLADYRGYERVGTFKPVALLGGEAAVREPWRSTYAHLMAEMGWSNFAMNYRELQLFEFLEAKPRAALDGMAQRGVNAPLASSCGRLFDAVAAAVGIARERALYEGHPAIELEAAVDRDCLMNEDEELDYPFAIPLLRGKGLPYIEPHAMWQALLGDLILGTKAGVIAARFHRGLAKAIVRMAVKLAAQHEVQRTVALSGGVLQNRILFERVHDGLIAAGFTVLAHAQVPANDGGLSLGQAAVASARLLART